MHLTLRPGFIALGLMAGGAGFYTLFAGVVAARKGHPGAAWIIGYGLVALGIGVALTTWARRSKE